MLFRLTIALTCLTLFILSCATAVKNGPQEKMPQNRIPAQVVDVSFKKDFKNSKPLTKQLKYSQNGRLIEILKATGTLDLDKQLNQVYKDNSLDLNKKYILIKANQHPGLLCTAFFDVNSDQIYGVNFSDFKRTVLIAEYPESLKEIKIFTGCEFLPYISNEPNSLSEDAFNESTSSVVISNKKIYTSENNPGTSFLHPERSIYKIDNIEVNN